MPVRAGLTLLALVSPCRAATVNLGVPASRAPVVLSVAPLDIAPSGSLPLDAGLSIPTGPGSLEPRSPQKPAAPAAPPIAAPSLQPVTAEVLVEQTPGMPAAAPESNAAPTQAAGLQAAVLESEEDASDSKTATPVRDALRSLRAIAREPGKLNWLYDRLSRVVDRFAGGSDSLPDPEEGRETPRQLNRRRELLALSRPWSIPRQLEELGSTTRGSVETFRFAVIGDGDDGLHWWDRELFGAPGTFLRQLARIKGRPVDFIFQLGDMVTRGKVAHYLRFFQRLISLGLGKPYLTTPGNHDRSRHVPPSDSRLYHSIFGRRDYAFDRGGYRFISVDSSGRGLDPDQLRWLEQALQTDKRKVVFTHMPPAPIDAWTKYGWATGFASFVEGAEEFTRLMERYGVERVYVGHIHGFDVQEHRGVRYVLTGGGGSPLYPSRIKRRFHHYIEVEARPDGLRETVHPVRGASFVIP